MLAAAALTLIGGALAGLRAWHKHRRRVNVRINQVSRTSVYVHKISFPDNETPQIKSVGIWIEVEIHNYGETAILVTGIENANGENAPEPIIGWPIKEISFEDDVPTFGGTVDLPLRLDGQSGVKFFVLSEVMIIEPVGKLLYKIYGKIDPKKLRQFADKMAADCLSSLSPKFEKGGYRLSLPKLAVSGVNAPLIRKVNGKLVFEPKFGILPREAGATLLLDDPNCTPTLCDARALQHALEIILADGTRIVQRLKRSNNALWMLEKITG
jgi:hypothetical protein